MRALEPMPLTGLDGNALPFGSADGAPFLFTATVRVDGDPHAVFAELRDPSLWFPLGKRVTWHTGATSGIGAIRDFDVYLLGTFREQMIAWQPGVELAYTMIGTTTPLVSQMAERWRLARDGEATRLEWTVGAELSPLARPFLPALRLALCAMFVASARGLGKRAATYPAHPLPHAVSPTLAEVGGPRSEDPPRSEARHI